MPTHVCMPNIMSKVTDDAAMKQCMSHSTVADCVAPCSFVETSMMAKIADTKSDMCRPKIDMSSLTAATSSAAAVDTVINSITID